MNSRKTLCCLLAALALTAAGGARAETTISLTPVSEGISAEWYLFEQKSPFDLPDDDSDELFNIVFQAEPPALSGITLLEFDLSEVPEHSKLLNVALKLDTVLLPEDPPILDPYFDDIEVPFVTEPDEWPATSSEFQLVVQPYRGHGDLFSATGSADASLAFLEALENETPIVTDTIRVTPPPNGTFADGPTVTFESEELESEIRALASVRPYPPPPWRDFSNVLAGFLVMAPGTIAKYSNPDLFPDRNPTDFPLAENAIAIRSALDSDPSRRPRLELTILEYGAFENPVRPGTGGRRRSGWPSGTSSGGGRIEVPSDGNIEGTFQIPDNLSGGNSTTVDPGKLEIDTCGGTGCSELPVALLASGAAQVESLEAGNEFFLVGFEFRTDESVFNSIVLPHLGDDQYEIFVQDLAGQYVSAGNVLAGDTFTFAEGGVSQFSILGIEISLGIRPETEFDFPVTLTLIGAPPQSISISQITAIVPEPGSLAMSTLGLLSIAIAYRRRTPRTW